MWLMLLSIEGRRKTQQKKKKVLERYVWVRLHMVVNLDKRLEFSSEFSET